MKLFVQKKFIARYNKNLTDRNSIDWKLNSFVDTNVRGFHEFIRVRNCHEYIKSFIEATPLFTLPRYASALRMSLRRGVTSCHPAEVASNGREHAIFPLSLRYQHTRSLPTPSRPCLVYLDLSATNRKEGKHRAPYSFSLNDKQVDPDFSRQNYILFQTRARAFLFTISTGGLYIFSRALISA